MAVYTQLSNSEISAFLADYNVGQLLDVKPIAEGVSNTNYLLTTNHESRTTNYILTLFEKHTNLADLPFFMSLTEHLADKGIPCPRPLHTKSGNTLGKIKEKPAVLVEFLHGKGNPEISEKHLELLGEMTAKLHIAASDFKGSRANEMNFSGIKKIFLRIASEANKIEENLQDNLQKEFAYLEKNLPSDLPKGIIHADIFPDNVFFSTNDLRITGIIDFYYSCTDFFAYELAIILNAWCFDAAHNFVPDRAFALINSYRKIRGLNAEEIAALPALCRLAAMRFLVTRADAWLHRDKNALVNAKDPMEYVAKLKFWQNTGWKP